MATIEDIEQIYYAANSREFYDYLLSLKPVEDNKWKIDNYKGFVIVYNNINSIYTFYPIKNPDNTLDWISLNNNYAVIIPQHLISRYRKRVLELVQDKNGDKIFKRKFDIRKNPIDSLTIVWNMISNIDAHLIFGLSVSDKYKDTMFCWCEDGLIPIEQLSDLVYKLPTLIPFYKLRKEQWEIWKAIYSILVEKNILLDKNRIQFL